MAGIRMFVNGQAMRGGSLHHALEAATFLGAVETAPRYRFYAFRGQFPGLRPVTEGGVAVPGELYEISYADLREKLLPGEPEELELSAIELGDGSGALSMIVRAGEWDTAGAVDISGHGGWHSYMATMSHQRGHS